MKFISHASVKKENKKGQVFQISQFYWSFFKWRHGSERVKQLFLLCFLAFLRQHAEGVEEVVQRRVEGHQEDGHGDVRLVRDGSSCGGQHTQQADKEPAQEVRQDNGGQGPSDEHKWTKPEVLAIKRAKLYSDLFKAMKREPCITLGSL